jgi:hypothetical protein
MFLTHTKPNSIGGIRRKRLQVTELTVGLDLLAAAVFNGKSVTVVTDPDSAGPLIHRSLFHIFGSKMIIRDCFRSKSACLLCEDVPRATSMHVHVHLLLLLLLLLLRLERKRSAAPVVQHQQPNVISHQRPQCSNHG